MNCPECNAESAVIDSRKRDNLTQRRRQCVAGHRFTTLEFIAPRVRTGALRRKRGGKHPPELKAQCLADRAAGDMIKTIAHRYHLSNDTVVDWVSRRTK